MIKQPNDVLEKTLRMTRSGILVWEHTNLTVKHDFVSYYNNWYFLLSHDVLRLVYGKDEFMSIYRDYNDQELFESLHSLVVHKAVKYSIYDLFMELPE